MYYFLILNMIIKRLDYAFSILKTILLKGIYVLTTNLVGICMQFENIIK